MPKIKLETYINANINECFDLFRNIDLHNRTSHKTKERAIAGRTSGLIEEGEQVTFQGVHFFITQTLTSKVIVCQNPTYFVAEMVQGAFEYMRHERKFIEHECGTLVKETFDYVSPFGIIGKMFDWLVLERHMRLFLEDRNAQIKRIAEESSE